MTIVDSVAPSPARQPSDLALPLRPREVEMLALVARGFTNGDIGAKLYLSQDTVKTHMRRAFQRLGARDRAHAVVLAMHHKHLILLSDGRIGTDDAPTARGVQTGGGRA